MAVDERWPGHAVLQVPVRPLDEHVRAGYLRHDPSLLGRGPDFVHAHVTVLGPFDEVPDLASVASLAASCAAFEARCEQVELFQNGTIHTPAGPRARFGALTRAAQRTFPEVVPYRGQFGVSPHVTLEALAPGVDVASVAEGLGDVLPASYRVAQLDLVWYEQGNTHLVARFPFGC